MSEGAPITNTLSAQTPSVSPPKPDEDLTNPATAERSHHPFSPSKLQYLDACPGFEGVDSVSEAAEHGTKMHGISEEIIREAFASKRPLLTCLAEYCAAHPLDDADRGLLAFCFREIQPTFFLAGAISQEIRVTVPGEGPNDELTGGYIDLLRFFWKGESLAGAVLTDFKFGWVLVHAAAENLQGKAYALAVLLANPELPKLIVEFIQPRLSHVSRHTFTRADIPALFQEIESVISTAKAYREKPAENTAWLSPNAYCAYCRHAAEGTCPAKTRQLAVAFAHRQDPPAPVFNIDRIDTPEKAALARWWVEQLTAGDFLEAVKGRAKEIAKQNGGTIEAVLPDGETVCYKIEERGLDRQLGPTLEVAEALRDVVSQEEVLGCAELSLTKLESVATNAIYEQANAGAERAIAEAEKATAGLPAKEAKKHLKAVKEAHPRITKKDATEQFQGILTAQGLLTKPHGTIDVLRRQKNTQKQLNK